MQHTEGTFAADVFLLNRPVFRFGSAIARCLECLRFFMFF
jgi:hypothetical protein